MMRSDSVKKVATDTQFALTHAQAHAIVAVVVVVGGGCSRQCFNSVDLIRSLKK